MATAAVSCWQTGAYWLTRGKKTQLSFPHNGAAQTEGKECTEQIFTCCQPGFLSLSNLKHFFTQIHSFLCRAGKLHVITVVPKQDKKEVFKIGPQTLTLRFVYCVDLLYTLQHSSLHWWTYSKLPWLWKVISNEHYTANVKRTDQAK